MSNPQISAAEWFRNVPSFIPAEEVRALRDRAAAHMKREREEALRRAAELEADLRALAGEDETEGEEAPVASSGATATVESKPDSTWSNRAIVAHFSKHNPGARAADYFSFLAGFRPNVPEETTKANVYDALKTLKADGKVRAEGRRGDYQYFWEGGEKSGP